MIVKGIIFEDTVNYKKISMTIEMPYCSFKCDKECGEPVCQNSALAAAPDIHIYIPDLLDKYINNPMTEAIVFQGLEPLDSFDELLMFLILLRNSKQCMDDVVIYTGYDKKEVNGKIHDLMKFPNIIVKFGRYIPNQESHYDPLLGVELASPNQYAERIS